MAAGRPVWAGGVVTVSHIIVIALGGSTSASCPGIPGQLPAPAGSTTDKVSKVYLANNQSPRPWARRNHSDFPNWGNLPVPTPTGSTLDRVAT